MPHQIKSVKRTAETDQSAFSSAVRFCGLHPIRSASPSSELLGYYQSSAARTN